VAWQNAERRWAGGWAQSSRRPQDLHLSAGHGQALAKGLDVQAGLAEIARPVPPGCSKGKGGFDGHFTYPGLGLRGRMRLWAAGPVPPAAGAALGAPTSKGHGPQVGADLFFGEGAVPNQGRGFSTRKPEPWAAVLANFLRLNPAVREQSYSEMTAHSTETPRR